MIELLVVIAIVGILASIALVNSGRNEDRDVRLEADRFSSFLRDVQNKTLSSEKISGAEKVCGFGIRRQASGSEVLVYYAATTINGACADVSKTYPGSSYKLEKDTFYFKNGVTVSDFSDIFFLSPNGEVYYNGSSLGTGTVAFDLTKDAHTLGNAISINGAGRIY